MAFFLELNEYIEYMFNYGHVTTLYIIIEKMKSTIAYTLILVFYLNSSYSQTKTGQWVVCQGYYAGLIYTIEEGRNGLWSKVNDSNKGGVFYHKIDDDIYVWKEKRDTLEFLIENKIKRTLGNWKKKESVIFLSKINDAVNPSEEIIASCTLWRTNENNLFTIEKWNSDGINDKSWYFENVSLEFLKGGELTIKGQQVANRCKGFRGRIFLDIQDEYENVIARVYFKYQKINSVICFRKCDKRIKNYDDIQKIDFSQYPEILIKARNLSLGVEKSRKIEKI